MDPDTHPPFPANPALNRRVSSPTQAGFVQANGFAYSEGMHNSTTSRGLTRPLFQWGTVFCLVLLVASSGQAEPGDLRLTYSNLSVLRVNPQGLQNDFKAEVRMDLYGKTRASCSKRVIGRSHPLFHPCIRSCRRANRSSASRHTLPGGSNGLDGVLGTFNHVLGFPDLNGDGSDAGLKDRQDAGDSIQTTGRITTLTGEVRGKVGPVVARSKAAWIHTSMDLLEGDRFWYEGINDVFMPENGWGLHVDTDLLWMDGSPWVAGVRHTVDRVFVDEATREATDNPERLEANHRIGPFSHTRGLTDRRRVQQTHRCCDCELAPDPSLSCRTA